MLKRSITGTVFKRILKVNNILPSVFAFKAKIELTEIKQALESKNSVPERYIYKLEQIFNITEQKV